MSQLLATRLGVSGVHLGQLAAPPAPEAAVLIGQWLLNETAGTVADDAAARDNDGTYNNVILNQAPLIVGSTGRSVRFLGDSSVAIPHVPAVGLDLGYEVSSYSWVVYFQIFAGESGQNAMLVQKDRIGLPGGFQIGLINDGTTFFPQIYTKNALGQATFIGSSAGIAEFPLAIGTAYRGVLTLGPSGTRFYVDDELAGTTGVTTGLLLNDEQIGIGRYRPGMVGGDTAGFNGWIDNPQFFRNELTQAEINALPDAMDLVVDEVEPPPITSFPFVTVKRPAAQNLAVPPFNATNPRAARVTDPMSGLQLFPVLPPHNSRGPGDGTIIMADGSDSGFHVAAFARHQSSPNDNSWNCDGTRLFLLFQTGSVGSDGGPRASNALLRTSDWRVTRVNIPNSGTMFWDGDDPDILWRRTQTLQYFRYNVVTGVETAAFTINGYVSSTTNQGTNTVPGRMGYSRKTGGPNLPGQGGARYQTIMARRTSDDHVVMFNVRLDTGTKSGDIDFGTPDGNGRMDTTIDGFTFNVTNTPRVSARGTYCLLAMTQNGSSRFDAFIPPASGSQDATEAHAGNVGVSGRDGPLQMDHPDTGVINNQEYMFGVGGGNPITMTLWNIDTDVKREVNTIPNGANPHTCSWQNRFDLAETFGSPTGSGMTSGRRYALHCKNDGMWLTRVGPNDEMVTRFLGSPRAVTAGDDDLQPDAVISPDGLNVIFCSNWRGAGGGIGGTGGPCSPYVLEIPDAHYSPNNDGSI